MRDNAGAFKETISDGLGGGFTTGCAFDAAGDLYTTNFTQNKVVKIDDASPHNVLQVIDTTLQGGLNNESIVFAANGDFYVGNPDGNDDIQRYDATGTFQQAYDVAIDGRGSDWMDLAADQATMFYTGEGRIVKRYDVASDSQLADFAVLPGRGNAFALRLLPPGDGSGGLIVADDADIKRLDGTGAVVRTYDVAGENGWFSLNLDPNGTSFWAGDFGTSNYYRFNIATGTVEVGPINTGTGGLTLFGICVVGEPTAALVGITLEPEFDSNFVGADHTVTATLEEGGNPVVGEVVTFEVTSGPNAGSSGTCSANTGCTTDANGEVSFTYTGSGGTGTDTIVASFVNDAGDVIFSQEVEKEWIASSLFLVIDEDSIDSGAEAIEEIADALGVDSSEMVNDDIADKGVRTPFDIPVGTVIGDDDPAGTESPLMTGEVGDEGWFALQTIPVSWDAAGPDDGLRNFVNAAPGLGTGDDPEALLDKIPDVTPLRTAGLKMLGGERVCALVYDSDISINYDPLDGSLKGANLGLVAFDVLAVGDPDDETLPSVTIQIVDTNQTCGGALVLFLDAPTPISSSEPSP